MMKLYDQDAKHDEHHMNITVIYPNPIYPSGISCFPTSGNCVAVARAPYQRKF